MVMETVATAACASAGLMAYAVRGRSATLLAPSVWKGPQTRRAIAMTFDDGPSESTPELLEILAQHRVRATFFQCGANARRLPEVARHVVETGHEIGNHTENHPALYLRSSRFIHQELAACQSTLEQITGVRPRYFRPPYGTRWFGLRSAQKRLCLDGVMWSCIALDWRLPTERIVSRLVSNLFSGAIFCLHDGRELQTRPNARPTIEAVREFIPEALERGFEFCTVTDLLCQPQPSA